MAVGIKPEGRVRWLVVDVDRKVGSKSPYWDERGRNLYLQSLIAATELTGCKVVLIRSSTSKGLHLWILLPEMVHVSRAHHIGQELVARAGMVVRDGSCELFPSEIGWVPKGQAIPESKGIRLPGGHGSALITADGLVDDPGLIYEALQQALEQTTASAAWEALLADAQARCQTRFERGREQRNTCYVKRPEMPMPWTGKHQSNYLTGEITKVAMAEKAGQPDAVIVAHAIDLITSHPGYQEWASVKTKRSVADGSKVEGWMAWLRKRAAGMAGINEKPRNSGHNAEQMQRVRMVLMEQLRAHGEAVLSWSKRELMRATGLNWRTVLKWWGQLEALLKQVMHTPPIKALHHEGQPVELVLPAVGSGLEAEPAAKAQGDGLDCLAVGSDSIKSLDPVPPAPSAETATCGVIVETQAAGLALLAQRCQELRARLFPVKAVGSVDPPPGSKRVMVLSPEEKRERERAELEAWLANTA